MYHQLSFAHIKILSENTAEVIINHGVKVTIEMVEEYDKFLTHHFKGNFGLIINKINHYSYTYEAQLSIASMPNLSAIAIIIYDPISKQQTDSLLKSRQMDRWNTQEFSGLELGYQKSLEWLAQQLQTNYSEKFNRHCP